MPDTRAAVEVTDTTLSYGDHIALEIHSITVREGTVTALIGPNGSGKSTLLHALAGLLRPRHGQTEVLGAEPGIERRRVGYVLQSTEANQHMPLTVAEAVAMGRYATRGWFGGFRAADRRAVAEAMERLVISDLARRQLGELSGGQRQRVFVAQGLAQEADLLLLDEPIGGLDLVSRQAILDVMAGEREAGRTVVFSTHDLGEAAQADHLLLLAGRVVASGPAPEVLTEARLAEAYGGRLVRLDGGAVLLDDGAHHHDRPPAGAPSPTRSTP